MKWNEIGACWKLLHKWKRWPNIFTFTFTFICICICFVLAQGDTSCIVYTTHVRVQLVLNKDETSAFSSAILIICIHAMSCHAMSCHVMPYHGQDLGTECLNARSSESELRICFLQQTHPHIIYFNNWNCQIRFDSIRFDSSKRSSLSVYPDYTYTSIVPIDF